MGCIVTKIYKKPTPDVPINTQKKLIDCTYADTPRFNFNNKIYEAKCVKVYDGDTITVVFMVFDEYYKFSVRMLGYDSPEMKSQDADPNKKELEKKWACASRDFLADIILDKIVTLKCKTYDKYGRILGSIEYNGKDINQLMITNGYCRPYDGGHKNDWDFSGFDKLMEYNKKKNNK